MTPMQGFMHFSSYILDPRDTGFTTPEAMGGFAARDLSPKTRIAAARYMEEQLRGTDLDLRKMWGISNSKVCPYEKAARTFTQVMIKMLREPKIRS